MYIESTDSCTNTYKMKHLKGIEWFKRLFLESRELEAIFISLSFSVLSKISIMSRYYFHNQKKKIVT